MAKETKGLTPAKYPKELPAGVETIKCERTFSGAGVKNEKTGKVERPTVKVVASFNVPTENGEGVTAFISLLSALAKSAGVKDDKGNVIEDYGVRFAAGALRQATVAGLTAGLTDTTHADTLSCLPPLPSVRTVDPFEGAAMKLAEFTRSEKRRPTEKESAAIYAEFGL